MKKIKILLVEDNEGDVVLTLEALEDAKIVNEVIVKKDGDEALKYLFHLSDTNPKLLPDLVLLDINLPKVDGKEVLLQIKSHLTLKIIPVVILTTSSSEKDVMEAYTNYANCYITKPVDLSKFFQTIKAIESFWVSIAKLPITNTHD